MELFCRKHGDVLRGKVIVYKQVEHGEVGPHDGPNASPVIGPTPPA